MCLCFWSLLSSRRLWRVVIERCLVGTPCGLLVFFRKCRWRVLLLSFKFFVRAHKITALYCQRLPAAAEQKMQKSTQSTRRRKASEYLWDNFVPHDQKKTNDLQNSLPYLILSARRKHIPNPDFSLSLFLYKPCLHPLRSSSKPCHQLLVVGLWQQC